MGVKVVTGTTVHCYESATDWFVSGDGDLQIYQPVYDNPEFTIAEYARGKFEFVCYDPIPDLPQPEGEDNEKGSK